VFYAPQCVFLYMREQTRASALVCVCVCVLSCLSLGIYFIGE